jgi:hypothetical protein
MLELAFVSVQFLRHFGCKLPIEFWHNNELSEQDVAKISKWKGITIRNLVDFIGKEHGPDKLEGKNYGVKGGALHYTTFDEVLFLDSDNFIARDLNQLFNSPAFKETGAVFWPDFWKANPNNAIYKILKLKCIDEFEQESGQVLLRKSHPMVQMALALAFHMQQDGNFYYKLVWGDKDTFRFSFRAIGADYHMVRANLGVLGAKDGNTSFCGNSMVQFMPIWEKSKFGSPPKDFEYSDYPQPMFIHANLLKGRPYDEVK